jgi:hypothetical protein
MKVAANLVREMAYAAAKYVATDDEFWRQQMDYLEGELAMPREHTAGPTGAEVECARRLAVSLHDRHYPEVTNWRPAADLVGILTQIDNRTSELVRQNDGPPLK